MKKSIKRVGNYSIDKLETTKKYILLETGLFSEISAGFLDPNLKLIGTDYFLFENNIARFTRWLHGPTRKVATLEEVFDNIPPEIGGKMAFYLDILPK